MSATGQLRWRCRRGMRELDELLTRYVDEQYTAAPAEYQAAFRALLDSHDPLIYDYFLGRRHPDDPILRALIESIARAPVVDSKSGAPCGC